MLHCFKSKPINSFTPKSWVEHLKLCINVGKVMYVTPMNDKSPETCYLEVAVTVIGITDK